MAAANFEDSTNFWEIEDTQQKYFKLFNNEFLSDITFFIGEQGTRVPGHSFVLILRSWDFFNVFKLLKLDKYEFIIEDVPESSFMAFLEYCYTNFTKFTKFLDKTLDILKLSQRFHMKTLEMICLNHLTSNLSIMKCMRIYKNREIFSAHHSVLDAVFNYIGEWFPSQDQIEMNMDIFLEIPLEAVMEIDKRCFNNRDEKEWFYTLMKWARSACQKQQIPPLGKNLRMILGDLFCKIRFPAMTAKCFLGIIANYPDLLTTKEISEFTTNINDHPVDHPVFVRVQQLKYDDDSRVVLFGRTVHCFTGLPKMDRGVTDEMTSQFGAIKDNVLLLGFAFVARRNEVVHVISCKLKYTSGDVSQAWENITTNPAGRYQVNEEYDLIAIRFGQEYELYRCPRAEVWLYCKFDKPVPNLSARQLNKIHVRGIWYNLDVPYAIPYLIFSES